MADQDKPNNNDPIPPFANTPLSSERNAEEPQPQPYQTDYSNDSPAMDADIPAVAESGKKSFVFLIIAVVGILFVLYITVFQEDQVEIAKNTPKPITKPVNEGSRIAGPVAVPPPMVETPEKTALDTPPPAPPPAPPPPPPPPPTSPAVASIQQFSPRGTNAIMRPGQPSQTAVGGQIPPGARNLPAGGPPADVEAKRQARMQAPMLRGGGGGQKVGPTRASLDADDFVPGLSAAQNVRVTRVPNPTNTILQGKVLDAVLETAINSDLPGVLRAIVSRDVYAEKGRLILVPKGSRLVGSYESEVKRGQGRIYIVWNRIIRPDGIDIALDSPATDRLGRSGVEGTIDNKYLEIFSNSLLLSTVTVGFAAATEALSGSDGVQQGETGSGSATTSGNVTDIATLDAVQNFSDTAKTVVGDLLNVKPTITIDQGTAIKVFVNRDVFFPKDLGNGPADIAVTQPHLANELSGITSIILIRKGYYVYQRRRIRNIPWAVKGNPEP